MRNTLALAGFLGLSYAAAAAGSVFTRAGSGEWYDALQKPAWTPPGALIGAVWSVLYGLMGVAAWLVWRHASATGRARALTLWGIQLGLNVLWSALFFGLRAPGAAFWELVLLEAAVVATLAVFWRIHPGAGVLLLPYAAWVAFAGFLNFTIWRLNA